MKRRGLLLGACATACAPGRLPPSGDESSGTDADVSSGGTSWGSTSGDDVPDSGSSESGDETGGEAPLDIPDLDPRIPTSIGRASRRELSIPLRVLDGALPGDAHGHYFMVCPIPWQDGTVLVNGDGMVFRIDFEDGEASLESRFVRSPCFYAESAFAGTEAAFSNPGGGPARMSSVLGVRNQANTGLVPMGEGRLLVTYDAGRPFELDPVTLEAVTPVGYQSEWKPALENPPGPIQVIGSVFPLVSTSAHPTWDPHTRELFTVNYGQGALEVLGTPLLGEQFTHLMRWTGAGALESYPLVDGRGQPVVIEMSAHQMHVTERYVVIQDSAFRIETAKMFDASSFTPQESDTTLWIVDRSHLSTAESGSQILARRITIPRESPHFMVDYANPGGMLTVHLIHNNGYDASEWLLEADTVWGSGAAIRQEMRGMLCGPTDVNSLGRYTIDVPNGTVVAESVRLMQDDERTWGITLYTHRGQHSPEQHDVYYVISTGFAEELCIDRVTPSYASHPFRDVPLAEVLGAGSRPPALLCCDPEAGGFVDGYAFPSGRFVSSPQFMPKPNAVDGTDGYILLTVVSDDPNTEGSSGDEFWLFDAADLARGPLCRLGHHEVNLPFTLHTTWLPELEPRDAAYSVDTRLDLQPGLADADPWIAERFESEIFPHFD